MKSHRSIRLFVTVGQRLFRDSLLFQLLQQDEVDLVGESETGIDTLNRLLNADVNVLIIEENLRDNDGLTIAENALSLCPSMSVLLISDSPVSASRMSIYLEAGIKAVVSKTHPIQELIKTLLYIRNGQTYVSSWHTHSPKEAELEAYTDLSRREREVAKMMANRIPVKEIAEQLGVSCKTVHSYKDRIFIKLGFERLPELILFMKRHQNAGMA